MRSVAQLRARRSAAPENRPRIRLTSQTSRFNPGTQAFVDGGTVRWYDNTPNSVFRFSLVERKTKYKKKEKYRCE